MGTEITLTLNGVDIDWGKNRYWRGHHWLFPPGSLTQVEYEYAHNVVEMKPGFETTLGETLFRLRHLGYSLNETKAKFDVAVERWNRTAELRLSFDDFRSALVSLDFRSLSRADMEPYGWDFRTFVVNRLAAWDMDDAGLEDFIGGLDFAITLRLIAGSANSGLLPLRWHHQDLLESGWVSLKDLTDIDRSALIINNIVLFGRLQDYAGLDAVKALDGWLAQRKLRRRTTYVRGNASGITSRESMTLPAAVRNMIHHPENPHNRLTDDDLRESIELLLGVARNLPTPIPGLA